MSAIFKREFKTFFTSPIGYFVLAVLFGFSGFYFFASNMYAGSADLSGVFGGLFTIAMTLLFIAALIFLFMSGMKPVVSLAVMCKAGTDVAIGYQSMQHFRLQTAQELLPTAETETAIQEVGAIINDIQRLGDYGIEKWRSAAREAQKV